MKGLIGTTTSYKYLLPFIPSLNYGGMKRLSQIVKASDSSVSFRIHVLECHAKHGTKAVVDSFNISKSTIYRWRKKYISTRYDPDSLLPKSTKPHNFRKMETNYKIVEFVRDLRKERGRIGKEKIKHMLDKYCMIGGMKTVSISTIGKLIKRYNLYYSPNRVYHNGRPKAYNRYRDKVKKSPKPVAFGYIQIDTITKFILGMKMYIFNAVDVKLKFQFSYAYKSSGSRNATDFFKKFEQVYPIEYGIRTVQSDNGSEFAGEFAKYLEDQSIKHVYIYPRCPKINGCVERSNRSLQEEFIDRKIDIFLSKGLEAFNEELMTHLIWYNTERVHKSLKNETPIDYLIKMIPESHMYVTHTNNCQLPIILLL